MQRFDISFLRPPVSRVHRASVCFLGVRVVPYRESSATQRLWPASASAQEQYLPCE